MTWALDEAAAEESKAALEARILDGMKVGQHVTFGWDENDRGIFVTRTADGYIVNCVPMDRDAALAQVAAFVY